MLMNDGQLYDLPGESSMVLVNFERARPHVDPVIRYRVSRNRQIAYRTQDGWLIEDSGKQNLDVINQESNQVGWDRMGGGGGERMG